MVRGDPVVLTPGLSFRPEPGPHCASPAPSSAFSSGREGIQPPDSCSDICIRFKLGCKARKETKQHHEREAGL